TISLIDWSSDVCSSDLRPPLQEPLVGLRHCRLGAAQLAEYCLNLGRDGQLVGLRGPFQTLHVGEVVPERSVDVLAFKEDGADLRSEERRVGKEWCRRC